MITLNRLAELIEKGETVYSTDTYIDGLILNCKDFEIKFDELVFKYKIYAIKVYDLYEDRGEALWNRDFANIERISTLSLPYWNEIVNDLTFGNYYGDFVVAEFDNYEIRISKSKKGFEKVRVVGQITIKEEPATEEGYRKICEYAKKQFLGR